MSRSTSGQAAVRWFLGFFGALLAVAVLPRTLVFMFRKMAGRLIAEALAITFLSVLAERLPSGRPRSRS